MMINEPEQVIFSLESPKGQTVFRLIANRNTGTFIEQSFHPDGRIAQNFFIRHQIVEMAKSILAWDKDNSQD